MTTVLQCPADFTRREARCTTTQAIGDGLRNRGHSQTYDPRSEVRVILNILASVVMAPCASPA
jgi:hypothetical protein